MATPALASNADPRCERPDQVTFEARPLRKETWNERRQPRGAAKRPAGRCFRRGRGPQGAAPRADAADALHPVVVHGRDVHFRPAAVLRAADVRQDGAAGSGRLALGVGRGHLLLSGRAARRLLLRPPADRPRAAGRDGLRSLLHLPAGAADPADGAAGGLDRAAARRALPVAAGAVHRRNWSALLGGGRQRAAAAGLVCPHRTSAGQGPVLPLRRLQSRQPDRAPWISLRARACVRAQGAGPHLDARLPRAGRGADLDLHADAEPAG